jgi:hypothetical protein
MRTSLVVASFGAVLAALAADISPSAAESAANGYPYCLMGRGGGSTTCYFKSRAECGNGCIDNPSYVGDKRAREILAGIGAGGAGVRTTPKTVSTRNAPSATTTISARNAPSPTKTIAAIDAGARASSGSSDDLKGYPTGYLVNRFGDHQAQGRF